MSERRAGTKGRRLGSSRRKQIREGSSEVPEPAPGPGEEQPWPPEIEQRVQDFFREKDKDRAGFVTRSDLQKFQEEGFPCSTEELELVFDGLDAASTGRLSSEEFTAGLRQFLSSQKAAREHRRRKTASRRVRLVLPSPALEGVDSEDRRHFAAFMDQLGIDNISEEQEIWQLWVKLQQEEPQLLGNLEDFLARMRHHIQEARSKKEALEVTLNKRVAEHDKEVQQLCEVLEQQIQQEQQRLEQTSVAQRQQQDVELQRVLDASEREVQRLVTAQMELERRCRSLHSTQRVASTENRELEESNRMLEDHLQHLHQQLKQTQGRLRTMRATVAWEHMEEPGDRVVAESPSEMPMSPQMSPGKSEKFRSEMRIRLGSQSDERKAKNAHQVVWEVLPAEISISGAPLGVSSAEEEPFPANLKQEHLSDQSSLLREMNDAIAALSKHLKAQASGAPPALADTASHPQDDAEPQTGQGAATAHGTTPGVLQDTGPGHVSHELFEGDLKEGPATAEFRALDVTQAGGSVGAGQHTAPSPGAEQGEGPEEAQRMIFLEGKGAGVKEMVLKVTEHLGESKDAGEQAVMEVEGAGWMQENTGWEETQLLGEAEEIGIRQGGSLEAGLGPLEAGQAGLAVGQCLATEQLQPGAARGEFVQALGVEPQEWADPSWDLSGRLEIELGERLEPEPACRGEAQVGAAQGDGVTPEVTVAPGTGVLEEEEEEELQPQGEPSDAEMLPAPAGMSCGAGGEEEEETQPREAELQLQGGSVEGDAGPGGSAGVEVSLAAAVPPPDVQEGGVGADVEPLEAQNSDTNAQLLAEVEADPQVPSEAGSPGTEQGGSVHPGVQPLEEEDEPQVGLGEERVAAEVHREGPSPAETPAGSSELCGLFPVKSQPQELVEAEDAQADVQLCGGLSPETLWGVKGGTDVQTKEEDGAQGQDELPQEPVLEPHGAAVGQGEGVGAGVQPQGEDENLDTLQDQSTEGNMQLLMELDELTLIPGGSTEADLQLVGEAGSTGVEQEGRLDPDVQPLNQVSKAEVLEMEAEDAQVDVQLCGGLSPGARWGGEGGTVIQLEEEEDGAQGQDECELPQEPVLDPHGAVGPGGAAGAGVQVWDESESLDTTEDQSTDGNMQLLTEVDELALIPGGSTKSDLQPLSETDSLGTEQGGSLDAGVQPLDQVSAAELVEMEPEDSWRDKQLSGDASPETPQQEGSHTAVELRDEAEDWGQGQGEHGLPQEPVLDTLEGQSTGANMQLLAEEDELRLTPGWSIEADLQPLNETDSLGTEQGGSLDPGMQPLEQEDKAELVEMETQDSWTDMQLCGDASPETPQGKEGCAAVQLRDEAEDGGQGLGEPVLDLQGARAGQGAGAGAGAQSQEEAESLGTLEGQSTGANMQPFTEEDELQSASGGSAEADLAPLGAAGVWEGEQSLASGVGAGLCAAHVTDTWEGAAAAHVPPPAEADPCPEPATAAKGLGLEAKLGAPAGPDGQILGDTQALELPLGERAAAEGRPLDGAQGLEVVQGERLEAGARRVVQTQGVGRHQGHDDGVSAPAAPLSEVLPQTAPVKLETLMQEDVLIPDVWRLCFSGQAAHSELQEQVSAQGHPGRIHAPAQQPEGKTPRVVEPEQVAAGPTEPPKQELPPVLTLHLRVQQQEEAGNDQLGMVLADSSLGDAAKGCVQSQRQLLGEQSEELTVGQQEQLQEFGQKMSREGKPSPGEAEAVAAEGAGAAPKGCPKAPLDPDHLYNVLFVGDSHVGKTSFLYRLHADSFNPNLTATVGLDYRIKNLVVDNKRFALRLWDSAGQERYRSMTKQFFRKADGVVLMYDITSQYSFSDVRYWLSCIQEAAEDGVAVLLLGNKTDCAAERQVPVKEGECLAKEHQLMFYECSAASGHNVLESMVSFIRLLKVREDELKNKAEEVPKAPQKKKYCCW